MRVVETAKLFPQESFFNWHTSPPSTTVWAPDSAVALCSTGVSGVSQVAACAMKISSIGPSQSRQVSRPARQLSTSGSAAAANSLHLAETRRAFTRSLRALLSDSAGSRKHDPGQSPAGLLTLQSRCLGLPRGGPTRSSLRSGCRQKELHLNVCRSRPCSPLRILRPSATSSPHPPREGGHAHEEEPPAPCLVPLELAKLK